MLGGPCELGAAAFAREFDGTRKELFNELNYGGSPGVDGGRAVAGRGRGAKRAGRGAKAEWKRRGWQVASSGAPSGAARGAAAPTVLETAGTTLGEAQLLATLAGAKAAAEASNEKIARRMQEEEDRGAAAEEGAEEAAKADKVLGEVLGDLGEQAEEIAEAIDAGIDAGSEVIVKVNVIVIVNLPFARDSTRRNCRSRARAQLLSDVIDVLDDEAKGIAGDLMGQIRPPTNRAFGAWYDQRLSSPMREDNSDDTKRDIASVLKISKEKPVGPGAPTGSNGQLGGIQVG